MLLVISFFAFMGGDLPALSGGKVGEDKVSAQRERVFIQAKSFSVNFKAWKDILETLEPEQKEMLESDPLKRAKYLNYLAQVEIFSRLAKRDNLENDPHVKRVLEFKRKELLARLWLEREVARRMKNLRLTEKDLKLYYDSHQEEFHKKNGEVIPFSKVKDLIRKRLEDEYRRNLIKQIIEEFLQQEEVRIFP